MWVDGREALIYVGWWCMCVSVCALDRQVPGYLNECVSVCVTVYTHFVESPQ